MCLSLLATATTRLTNTIPVLWNTIPLRQILGRADTTRHRRPNTPERTRADVRASLGSGNPTEARRDPPGQLHELLT